MIAAGNNDNKGKQDRLYRTTDGAKAQRKEQSMKRTMKAALGAVPLLVLVNAASAGEPMQLSDQQMDGVTAAGSAFANAIAAAVGGNVAFTQTAALARVAVVATFTAEATRISLVQSDSQARSFSEAQ
jgi:hypothetical protein